MIMKQMKFLATMAIAVLCLGFYSCSDDNDNSNDGGGNVNYSEITGTWQRTHLIYRYTNSNHPEWSETEDRDETGSEAPLRRTIDKDGTFNEGFWKNGGYILGDGDYTGYWKLEGKVLSFSETKEFVKGEYDYYNIIELTENLMVLEVTEIEKDEDHSTSTYYNKETFKRIK